MKVAEGLLAAALNDKLMTFVLRFFTPDRVAWRVQLLLAKTTVNTHVNLAYQNDTRLISSSSQKTGY